MTEPFRDREELQRAHDILVAVAAGEASSFFPVDARQEFIFAIDVLCWALRHDHNKRFAERLGAIEERMNSLGIELRRYDEMQYPGGRPPERPLVVCLCGSTRFEIDFEGAAFAETKAGHIVLSVGSFHRGDDFTPDEKQRLDELHRRKIDMADEVLVINVGGYIGKSTRAEIEYAEAAGKPVRYLEAAHAHHG